MKDEADRQGERETAAVILDCINKSFLDKAFIHAHPFVGMIGC